MKPIRLLREHEVPAVVALWDENTGGLLTPEGRESIGGYMRACLTRSDAYCLVAEAENGELVGFATAIIHHHPVFPGATGEVEELYVRPIVQRQGYGTRLIAAASNLLRENGATVLHVMVPLESPEAVEFWKTTGWESEYLVYTKYD